MARKYLQPGFFIIGERKCGSSSLYRYLLEHPQVLPCKLKEPQFFSKPAWYRRLFFRKYLALFPVAGSDKPVRIKWYHWPQDPGSGIETKTLVYPRKGNGPFVTGEASANYFEHADPSVLNKYFPQARCILLLRDPPQRAWSHYRMLVRFHEEGRKLPFTPGNFLQDVKREIQGFSHGAKGYFVPQGVYLPGILRWRKVFEEDRFRIILSDILNSKTTLTDLCHFLGIKEFDFKSVDGNFYNVSEEREMDSQAKDLLDEFYAPHIRQLEDFLGLKTHWV